eukprot:7363990-Pyramimonas_sp.AAC.1
MDFTLSHPTGQEDNGTQQYCCYECGFTCYSSAALQTHITKTHRSERDPDNWAAGSLCQICLTEFHCRARLVKHLKRVPRCAHSWLQSGRAIEHNSDESKAADRDFQSKNRKKKGCMTTVLRAAPIALRTGPLLVPCSPFLPVPHVFPSFRKCALIRKEAAGMSCLIGPRMCPPLTCLALL